MSRKGGHHQNNIKYFSLKISFMNVLILQRHFIAKHMKFILNSILCFFVIVIPAKRGTKPFGLELMAERQPPSGEITAQARRFAPRNDINATLA
jgi:hypothetical protein